MKEKCDCGKDAVWCYMPCAEKDNPYYCEKCVPRGCSCNERLVVETWNGEDHEYYPEGDEGKDWKWIVKGHSWEYLDGEGLTQPCCEFWYEESGWSDADKN